MSHALLTFAALALVAAADAAQDLEKFQGDWVIVSYTVDGKPAADDLARTIKLNVKGNVSTFTIGAASSIGTYQLDPSKQPKWLDIAVTTGKDKGKSLLSIYEFAGAELRICHSPAGGKERPKEFASKPGSGQTLEVWKKAK